MNFGRIECDGSHQVVGYVITRANAAQDLDWIGDCALSTRYEVSVSL